MGEIGRPVQRIDVPAKLALQLIRVPFFAINAVPRKHRRQPLADQRLAGAVRLRHQVHIALVLSLHTFRVELAQQRSGLPRNLLRAPANSSFGFSFRSSLYSEAFPWQP